MRGLNEAHVKPLNIREPYLCRGNRSVGPELCFLLGLLFPKHKPTCILACLTPRALLYWLVHRLLHYFRTAAMQDGLKSHYLSEWDHRNLLHVWPLKAFPHYRSQVRFYWNQFFILSQIEAPAQKRKWTNKWASEQVNECMSEWKNSPDLCEKCSHKRIPPEPMEMGRIWKHI